MAHAETIMARIPEVVRQDGVMQDYVEAHDLEFETLNRDLDKITTAKQVDTATGDDLDNVGAIFGKLGERRGRTDSDYRTYLKGVVQSFNGRGSVSGLKFAVAAAIGTDTDNIIIDEDFSSLEYDIQVDNVNASFISSAINDLADLSDPSVVELDEAIIIVDGDTVIIDEQPSTVTADSTGLGGGTLTLDGNSQLG
jgi:hypothetical protein